MASAKCLVEKNTTHKSFMDSQVSFPLLKAY